MATAHLPGWARRSTRRLTTGACPGWPNERRAQRRSVETLSYIEELSRRRHDHEPAGARHRGSAVDPRLTAPSAPGPTTARCRCRPARGGGRRLPRHERASGAGQRSLASLRTRAVRRRRPLRGQRARRSDASGANHADFCFFVLPHRPLTAPKHGGISSVLVAMDTPGDHRAPAAGHRPPRAPRPQRGAPPTCVRARRRPTLVGHADDGWPMANGSLRPRAGHACASSAVLRPEEPSRPTRAPLPPAPGAAHPRRAAASATGSAQIARGDADAQAAAPATAGSRRLCGPRRHRTRAGADGSVQQRGRPAPRDGGCRDVGRPGARSERAGATAAGGSPRTLPRRSRPASLSGDPARQHHRREGARPAPEAERPWTRATPRASW